MKIVGVLGGMSSVAGAEYYRRLNEGVNARLGGHAAAELLLYSVDFAVIEACVHAERWEQAADYLVERARRLERGGADFLVLATNTMHRVAPEIEAAVSIPLVHRGRDGRRRFSSGRKPARAVRDRACHAGRLLPVTLRSPRHRGPGAERARSVARERRHLQRADARSARRLVPQGVRPDHARAGDRGADGIVLGCTEISLLISPADLPGVALYDTTALHVGRAVQLALGLQALPVPSAD